MKAIVIGSGFGGLAAAMRLAAMKFDVTVLEKRTRVGGRAYQLKEAGYTFDMGPSLVTAPDLFEDLFARLDLNFSDQVTLVPLDPFYRIFFHDGSRIDYTGDADQMKTQMRSFDPSDADRYEDFLAAARPIYEAVITERLGAQPFDTVRSMLDFAPRAIRLGAYRSVARFAARYFQDFRHRFLFSFHPLFLGGHPFRSPAIYSMIAYLEKEQGVWFAEGGMYSIVQAMERALLDSGGTILTDSEVERIETSSGRAVAVHANGTRYEADLVVSNADVAHTYGNLIAPGARRKWTSRRLEKMSYSMSCFLIYLGVRRTYDQLAHHTLILSRRYKQLVDEIFDAAPLPDDFSMYLHAPTRTDSSMAPPGCESLYVLVPVSNLRSPTDWGRESEPFAQRIIAFLEAWGLDDLRENIEVRQIFTPLDFESELNSYLGNAFGIEPKLSQTAYFRPHNHSEDIDNLYFVGAGTHPGAGVPGVLLSAEATEYSIRRDLKLD
jgi:phytoene desaturase